MAAAIDAVSAAFLQIGAGQADVPLRVQLASENGVSLFMPGYLPRSEALGAKIVSVFDGNKHRGLPTVTALLLMLDTDTGLPRAMMQADRLTAVRTGAVSGLATDLLARHDAETLAVFGAGAQARTQIEAINAVRSIREVRVVSRAGISAERLAAELRDGAHGMPADAEARAMKDPDAAVRDADIIVTATNSTTPVFGGAAVRAGTHVNGIGSYTPEMQEVDAALVRRSRIIVDNREGALAEAGDLVIPRRQGVVPADYSPAELGEIVVGARPGRQSDEEITFFKSVGNAAQDLAIAQRVLARAESEDVGRIIEL